MLSNDVNRFDQVLPYLHFIWVAPIQLAILTFYAWQLIGISSLSGVLTITMLTISIHGYLASLTMAFRQEAASKTDNRVQKINEIVKGIQVIKMYAWEKPFEAIVKALRMDEIQVLTKMAYVRGFILSCGVFTERLALFATVVCYVLLGNNILAKKAFFMAQLFNNIQYCMAICLPIAINLGAEALVSIRYMYKFIIVE